MRSTRSVKKRGCQGGGFKRSTSAAQIPATVAAADHNNPKFAKKPVSRIPEPQVQRIMQRYAAGQTIREISREEGRARETVTRVVRSEEMQAFVNEMRERFYALADDALAAISHDLRTNKDGHLGYRLLADIGVIPTPEQRQAVEAMSQPQETQSERVERLIRGYTQLAMESYSAFGRPLEELEAELERKRQRDVTIPLLSGKD